MQDGTQHQGTKTTGAPRADPRTSGDSWQINQHPATAAAAAFEQEVANAGGKADRHDRRSRPGSADRCQGRLRWRDTQAAPIGSDPKPRSAAASTTRQSPLRRSRPTQRTRKVIMTPSDGTDAAVKAAAAGGLDMTIRPISKGRMRRVFEHDLKAVLRHANADD